MSEWRQPTLTLRQRLWVAVAIYGFFGFFVFPEWHDYERITHAGARTTGWVVATEPDNHASVRYGYRVGAHEYEGSVSAGAVGLGPLASMHAGDTISITYRLDRPAISLPGEPYGLYASWSGLLFIWLPLASLAMAASVGWRRGPRAAPVA